MRSSEEDVAFGQAQFESAPRAVRDFFIAEGGGEAQFRGLVISFLSTLRQGIEQELIQLRVTGSVLPLSLVNAACSHQSQLNVQSWAMSHPAFGRSLELLDWSCAVAIGPLRDLLLRRFEFEALVDTTTWRVAVFVSHRGPGRTAEEILCDECGVATVSGPGVRCGMWGASGGLQINQMPLACTATGT